MSPALVLHQSLHGSIFRLAIHEKAWAVGQWWAAHDNMSY